MSWGTKITVLYLGFVGIILTLVFTCLGHKTELEYKDYYAKELRYQDQIDATANADALPEPVMYSVKSDRIELILPKELAGPGFQGTVHFLRPSDASLDKIIELSPDAKQDIMKKQFKNGVYKMQISMSRLGKNYYKEAVVNIN